MKTKLQYWLHLWLDPVTSTRYIDCSIVNRRHYWTLRWALRLSLIFLLIAMLTHLPAPRGMNIYISSLSPDIIAAVRHAAYEEPVKEYVVYRSETDRLLLQSCRDRLRLRDAQHDRDLIYIALRWAKTGEVLQ